MSVELSKRERRWLRNKKATSIDKVEVYGIQATSVRLHSTDVVQLMQDRIILNTNGWKTPVTKRRMNQTSELYDLDYEVFQVNYEWYVKDSRECIHNFYGESVTIKR
tara:strand:- start:1146 stop:1466 length:321 start_codon:yes stop_codon:yes gene_type:complete